MGTESSTSSKLVPWKFHPRVFSALGAELVTNDLVALIELVKNAYDAMARRCDVRFIRGDDGSPIIEIQDNGFGMDRETLLNDWLTIGTPRKFIEKSAISGKRRRRVSGEKGLGRLSAARLGNELRLTTKTAGGLCFRIDMDWKALAAAHDLAECNVLLSEITSPPKLGRQGTILEVRGLRKTWVEEGSTEYEALRTELARFTSPLSKRVDFEIFLTWGDKSEAARVKPEPILSHPPYIIYGYVDRKGALTASYKHEQGETLRCVKGRAYLGEASPSMVDKTKFDYDPSWPDSQCGPFRFEFRVWDLDKDELLGLAERLGLNEKVTALRREISQSVFSGVSLYRDRVLVLPKAFADRKEATDMGRDWLGLSARRVSRYGKRIDAKQLVGRVEVSGDANAQLIDTSDRERLTDNAASRQFKTFLVAIISLLERERERDRTKPGYKEPPLKDLLEALRSPAFGQKLDELEKRGGGWKEIRELVEEHSRELTETAKQIEQRFYYYSRLATIGSMAALLQHEVGNKVSAIEHFIERVREAASRRGLEDAEAESLELAEKATRALKRLADRFAPLASRVFGTRRKDSDLREEFQSVVDLHANDIRKLGVKLNIASKGATKVAVDPGELLAVLDNLLMNSLYWMSKVPKGKREVLFVVTGRDGGKRAEVRFHDSGPGIEDGDEERIFWPGVTGKEGGLGMGLTIASEIVASYGGKMFLIKPGDLGGASFGFDLPLARETK
jgi:signal transduction histidine kinase